MKYNKQPNPTIHTIDITHNELVAIIADAVRKELPHLGVPMLPTVRVDFGYDVAGKASAALVWKTNE